jgi:hypothetical protein
MQHAFSVQYVAWRTNAVGGGCDNKWWHPMRWKEPGAVEAAATVERGRSVMVEAATAGLPRRYGLGTG